MAHLTVYVPEHLFRRYQAHWPREKSLSAWLQQHLAAELDGAEAAENPKTGAAAG